MKQKLLLASCFSTVILLSGCASMDKAGQDLWNWDIRGNDAAAAPQIGRAAPLVVPPDFALEPTATVAPRAQDSGQDSVLEAMFGGPAPRSAAERVLSGTPASAEMGIRSSVGDPETNTVNKGSITRDIIAAPEGDGQTAQSVIPG
ncbi:MAG: DUF3035 domain-containing protein [Sphingorhabdus sp.]|uniref:DUF3035 domain-containing protein n=1 Tax=Sphingorhabdus sp. TaxID=1902408 RepID=UPI0038FC000D